MSKHTIIIIAISALSAVAQAQPAEPGSDAGSGSAATVEDPYPASPPPTPAPPPLPVVTPPPKPVPPPDPELAMPQLFSAPTGWLLPAAVLYSRTGLDTGGGVTSDQRVGLGDVAEFGLSTLDRVRERMTSTSGTDQIEPYIAATFRMGVAENRLFDDQPGVVIGFLKSFQRTSDSFTTRIAELTLVASKHFGSHVALHLGGSFWDASLEGTGVDTALHDRANHGLVDQIRIFGGVEVRPFARSEILVDWAYAPEFCYQCSAPDQIALTPELSWGARYEVAPWMFLESGVHVFDIDKANLLDAQIFGQVTFVTWGLRHAVDSLR
jgi:hypothetical protein